MNTTRAFLLACFVALLPGLVGCACSSNGGNIDDPFGEDTGDAGDAGDSGDVADMGDVADSGDTDDADTPSDEDGDGVPDDEDACPGSDDNIDEDGDDVPDGCDPCVREGAPNDDACPIASEFDTSFGDTGIMILEDEGHDVHISDIAWTQELGLIVGGSARVHGQDLDVVVARLRADGSLDPDFGEDGWYTSEVDGDDALHALDVSADGARILAAGSQYRGGQPRPALVQLTGAGVPDVAFGDMGWVLNTGLVGDWRGVLLDDAGNATVLGTVLRPGANAIVARYQAAGNVDPAFNLAELQDFGVDTVVTEAAHGADGVTYVVGHTEAGYDDDAHLLAVDTDGAQHADFNAGQAVQHDLTEDSGEGDPGHASDSAERLNGVRVDAEGRIVVTGEVHHQSDDSRDLIVVRVMPNGSLDDTFGDEGIVTVDFDGGRDVGHDLAIDAEGRIVVVGRARSNGRYGAAVLRLLPDGTPDETFGDSGKLLLHVGETSDRADAVAIDGEGRIVVAGRSNDGVRRRAMLLRLWD
jgi:uncharacterized delta-60 repeat protein